MKPYGETPETIQKPNLLPTPMTRRIFLKAGLAGATISAIGLQWAASAAPSDEELVPFLDMPRTGPNSLDWETLDSWLTPQDQVFNVQHYDVPEFDLKDFRLEITGLVAKPQLLTLEAIKALP